MLFEKIRTGSRSIMCVAEAHLWLDTKRLEYVFHCCTRYEHGLSIDASSLFLFLNFLTEPRENIATKIDYQFSCRQNLLEHNYWTTRNITSLNIKDILGYDLDLSIISHNQVRTRMLTIPEHYDCLSPNNIYSRRETLAPSATNFPALSSTLQMPLTQSQVLLSYFRFFRGFTPFTYCSRVVTSP